MEQYRVFIDDGLMEPPMARAAYSDRTALMMAEMAALAYIPFENPAEDAVLEALAKQIRDGKNIETAKKALSDFLYEYKNHGKGAAREKLMEYLGMAGFELTGTYNMLETQGFLAKRDDTNADGKKVPGVAVLSFRGTEKKIEDWRTDLDAAMTFVEGVGYHPGFWKAFASVQDDMDRDILPLLRQGYQLYITGHSLGGALALFAARHYDSYDVASCYTFGSPRVADYAFARLMKTPIYRVVNAHDIVPRMPPHALPRVLGAILFFCPLPFKSWILKKISNYQGYVHHGDMRYLTRGAQEELGRYEDVDLLSNPSMFDRTRWWVSSLFTDWKGPVKDHSIQRYCDKLRAYARMRNYHGVLTE